MRKFYRRRIGRLYFKSYYYHYMSGSVIDFDEMDRYRELNDKVREQLMSYIRGKTPRMLHYLRMDKDGTLDNLMHKAGAKAHEETRHLKRTMVKTYSMGIKIVTESERDFLRKRDGW
jgi:hypothetical protein